MLLAIDVGNTQTHVGVFRGHELVEDWRFATRREATSDELASLLSHLLSLRGLALADADAAVVSSVVPRLSRQYEQVSERYLAGALAVVAPGMRTGMAIRTEVPQELGTDRLVNAVAALDRYGAPAIVVDFGTSINYDVVSAQGEYLGGVLAPGVEISLEALAERAAKLPTVQIAAPPSVIGRTTQSAIQSGLIYGFAGQVDGIVGRLRDELDGEARVIATGGLAGAITPHCRQIDELDLRLTLDGLRLLWERNRDG